MVEILDAIDSVLYYPILLVVMAAAGLYFSLRMGFVQIHRLPRGCVLSWQNRRMKRGRALSRR